MNKAKYPASRIIQDDGRTVSNENHQRYPRGTGNEPIHRGNGIIKAARPSPSIYSGNDTHIGAVHLLAHNQRIKVNTNTLA
jgi:hypothetical protein